MEDFISLQNRLYLHINLYRVFGSFFYIISAKSNVRKLETGLPSSNSTSNLNID